MFWEVDLRPHGKRKYFSSKDAALGEAQIQRTRLRNEGLEGFEFTLEQRTDAKMAMAESGRVPGARARKAFSPAVLSWLSRDFSATQFVTI
jgi:hypothetical protein